MPGILGFPGFGKCEGRRQGFTLRAEKFDAVHENKAMDRSLICNENTRMLDISIMNNEIDLNLLVVFDAVWRHRRISRAAVELNSSQPTVRMRCGG